VGKQITVWYFRSQNTSCKYKCIYISTLDSKYCIVFVYIIFSETNMKLIDASHNSYRHYAFSVYAWVQSPVVLNDCNCCFSPTNGSFRSMNDCNCCFSPTNGSFRSMNDCNCCFSPTNGLFRSKRLVGVRLMCLIEEIYSCMCTVVSKYKLSIMQRAFHRNRKHKCYFIIILFKHISLFQRTNVIVFGFELVGDHPHDILSSRPAHFTTDTFK
jgi:hypothetical protein